MSNPTLLPFGPLLAAVEARGGLPPCGAGRNERDTGAVRRSYQRGKVRGALTIDAADVLAITLLGEHPSLIWGDEWKAALAATCPASTLDAAIENVRV